MNDTMVKTKRIYKGDSLIDGLNDYTIIDIETTGLDPINDKIIELAALKVRDNKIVDNYSTLINPKIEIDSFITELTGITNEMLENAPTIEEKLQEYIEFIGEDIIIGHNINFDINFIYDSYEKYFNSFLFNDYIDTLRLSRNFIKDTPNHKLKTLSEKFNINYDNAHRALNDCYITNSLYMILKEIINSRDSERTDFINKIIINDDNPVKNLKCVIKGKTKDYTKQELIKICRNNKIKIHSFFYNNDYDIIVLSKKKYQNYINDGGNDYYESNGKKIISEYEFYDLLGLDYSLERTNKKDKQIRAKDIISESIEYDENNPFFNKECIFTGALERMTRKDAMQLVANLGGKNRDTVTKETNYLILGNNDYCRNIKDGKSNKQKKAEQLKLKGQEIEIISENVFYDMIDDYIEN